MKRLILFCFLLSGTCLAKAQFPSVQNLNKSLTSSKDAFKKAGNLADSSETYTWNISKWDALMKKVYTYDAQNRVSVMQEYDANTGSYEHQYTYSYTSAGELSSVYMAANFSGTLQPFKRFLYNYDTEGNQTSYKTENYVSQQWVLDAGDSIAYVYDSQKRVTEYALYQLDGQNIYPYQKLIWDDFNSQNLPQTLIVQAYQGGFNNYLKLNNITWKAGFDLFNFNPSSYFGYLWSGGSWTPAIYDTAYVSNGKINTSFLFNWSGSQLDSNSRTEYIYDKMGLQMQTLTYTYGSGIWTPVQGERDSIQYGSFNETQTRTSSYFSQADKQFIYLNREHFYYNGLSIGNPINNTLSLYPNPANTLVYINLNSPIHSVEIIDLQGKLKTFTRQQNELDVRGLEPGIYFIRVNSEGNYYSGRLAIKH